MSGIVNILFLIFGKDDKRKNCARFFEICKYTFLIFEKGNKRRKCVEICKYAFLNIWQRK